MNFRFLIIDVWGQISGIDGTNDEKFARELSKAANLLVIDTQYSEPIGRNAVKPKETKPQDYGM